MLQSVSVYDLVNPTAPQSSMFVIAYSPSGNPQVIPMSYFETAGGDAEFNDVQVNDDLNVDGTTTLADATADYIAGTIITTNVAAASVKLEGTTISVDGTDANIDLNINAKGSGVAYLNQKWGVNASGTLVPLTDNTYDIGNGLVNPRDVNVSRKVSTPQILVAKSDGIIAANAVTTTGTNGTLTSPALTNAAGTAYTVTFTNTNITATSNVSLEVRNYAGVPVTDGIPYIIKSTPGVGSVVFNIYNIHATNALNGIALIDYFIT